MTRANTEVDLHGKYFREPNSGCWIWEGTVNSKGYAYTAYRGKTYRAHRLFFELQKGKIEKGLTLDHRCRVRCCVNPEHLSVVTQTENRRLGVRAQVSDEIVDFIRQQKIWRGIGAPPRLFEGKTILGLSKELNIPRTTISRILNGQKWRGSN